MGDDIIIVLCLFECHHFNSICRYRKENEFYRTLRPILAMALGRWICDLKEMPFLLMILQGFWTPGKLLHMNKA